MGDHTNKELPVVASLERIKRIRFDESLRQGEARNSWSLRIDPRALALLALIVIIGTLQYPEFLSKGSAWITAQILK